MSLPRTLPKASSGKAFPIGTYVCTLENMELQEPDPANNPYNNGTQVRFSLVVDSVIDITPEDDDDDDPDGYIGKTISAWANWTMGRRSKLRKWSAQIIGRDIQDDEELDINDLLGAKVKVTIGPTEQGNTKVAEMVRYRTKKRPTPAPTPAVDDDEDEEPDAFD